MYLGEGCVGGGCSMKPGKELFLLRVSLFFRYWQKIVTLSYFFFLVHKLYKYGLYIIYYIWQVSRYTNIVWDIFGTDIYGKIIYNNSQNIWNLLWFSCEISHNGKSLVSVFQEFSASINKTFILVGRLGTKLSFYEV